jgi:hypothetical protein
MARVTAKDREETGFPDGSFPVKTHTQRMSAIKLRGRSGKHSPESVLRHVEAAARKAGDKAALAAVKAARNKE